MNKRRKVIIIAAIVNLIVQGVLLSLSIEKGWQVYESRFWPFSGLYSESISEVYTEDYPDILNPTKSVSEAEFLKKAYEFKKVNRSFDDIKNLILDPGSDVKAYISFAKISDADAELIYAIDRAFDRGVTLSQLEGKGTISKSAFKIAEEYSKIINLRSGDLSEEGLQRIFPIRLGKRYGYNWLMGYNRTEFLIYGLLLSTLLVSSSYLRTTDKSD